MCMTRECVDLYTIQTLYYSVFLERLGVYMTVAKQHCYNVIHSFLVLSHLFFSGE